MRGTQGQLSVQVLIFSAIGILMLSGFVMWADVNMRSVTAHSAQVQSLMIAEAGIEYYRWHLAHAPQDFTDGTGHPGPYTHAYYDKNGRVIGQFSLSITPPAIGSTVVTITSIGSVNASPGITKTARVKMGIPSFAKYAWVLDDNVNFGSAAEVYGPIHSNKGIHFDGLAHNLVTSALTTYSDPDHGGPQEWAVHTHRGTVDPLPPTPLPNRPDVFMAGRAVGVPAVNFTGISQDLSNMRANSLNGGFHASSSGASGYEVVLKTNGTFDLYKVTQLVSTSGSCANSQYQTSGQSGWGTWSINRETLLGTYNMPGNGIIFLEDDTWVRGQINNARLTIAAARFPDNPATRANIMVNNALLYTNTNGADTIGLVAQNNITIGLMSDNNLTIDAALIAQNGRVGRYYYNSSCGSSYMRSQLATLGIIGSAVRSGVFYGSSGYSSRVYTYDTNLLYSPPPSFPLTADSYSTISWEELR